MYAAGAEGATRNGGSLSVSDRTDPETFLVSPVGRYRADRADVLGTANTAAAERLGDVRRFGSMQATLAFVASGELDAAFAVGSQHPWDAMGGIHLVRQAGGRVTDIDGERWTPDSDGFVATNGEAHDAVREVAERARDAGAE
jgi:myo-inositol-1(or 4)-monophosphatase